MVKLKRLLVTEICDFHTSILLSFVSFACSTIFHLVTEVKSIVNKMFFMG